MIRRTRAVFERTESLLNIASEVFVQGRLLARAVLCETDSRRGTATVRERRLQRSTCANISDAVFVTLGLATIAMKNPRCRTKLCPLSRRALSAIFVIAPLIGADQPEFEVASVKRARCTLRNSVEPGRIAFLGDPLKVVLMEAFQVKMDQIIGPSWLDADCFEFIANMP